MWGILPSGVAVYRSPFKDISGSRLIYGGPHKSFKNDVAGVMMSNAVFFIQTGQDELPGRQEQDEVDLMWGLKQMLFSGKKYNGNQDSSHIH